VKSRGIELAFSNFILMKDRGKVNQFLQRRGIFEVFVCIHEVKKMRMFRREGDEGRSRLGARGSESGSGGGVDIVKGCGLVCILC
jgi:hypothetical protein